MLIEIYVHLVTLFFEVLQNGAALVKLLIRIFL